MYTTKQGRCLGIIIWKPLASLLEFPQLLRFVAFPVARRRDGAGIASYVCEL